MIWLTKITISFVNNLAYNRQQATTQTNDDTNYRAHVRDQTKHELLVRIWLIYRARNVGRINCSAVERQHLNRCCLATTGSLLFSNGFSSISLQWRRLDCLLNRLFRRRSKKHQSSGALTIVSGIHGWPVNSPYEGPVTRKMFPFDDVII